MKRAILGLACAALAVPTYATAVFTLGNNPQPNEENVLFTSDQTAASVTGLTNKSDTTVDFSSTLDTLMVTAKGQANVTATDLLLNNISISLAGGVTFNDIILNPSAATKTDAGTTTVTAMMSDGTIATFTYASVKNGDNFLTVTTSGGELIKSITLASAGGVEELRQVRISGVTGAVFVPEPASMALMGVGLLLIPVLKRRWRS